MRHPLEVLTAGTAVAVLIGISGCGDTTPDGAAAADEGAEAIDCGTNPGKTVTVSIGDFVFDPTPVEVETCDSVVWTNDHDQPHTSTGNGDQAWSSGNLQPGASSDPVLFEAAGELAYICALHPFMEGTVTVA